MLMTSCIIIAIITGIICDTFGELRTQQDEAVAYRSNTCFITGITFSEVMPEKSTSHVQYAFLLVYLHSRSKSHLTPIEAFVYEEILHGSVAWLPKGRCFRQQEQTQEDAELDKAVRDIKSMLSEVGLRLGVLETAQTDLKTQLAVVHECVHTYGADDNVAV